MSAQAAILNAIRPAAVLERLARLTGPVFERDLRVASRQWKLHALRVVYLAVLTLFAVVEWQSQVGRLGAGSSAEIAIRMAEVGRVTAAAILEFQFAALPILAVIMLSASVIEEIQGRTLPVLMATPIHAFHIVLGKLLGRLIQLALLLAVSLPLLVVIRVFGGVDWPVVVVGLAITLTTCIAAGAVSMLVSTYLRRGYIAVFMTFAILAGVHAFQGRLPHWAPWLGSLLASSPFGLKLYALLNPYYALQMLLGHLTASQPFAPMDAALLAFHLVWILLFSTLLLMSAGRRMRRVGLGLALGEIRPAPKWERWMRFRMRRSGESPGVIRPVTGSPVLWREKLVHFGPSRFAAILVVGWILGSVVTADLVMVIEAAPDVANGFFAVLAAFLVALLILATPVLAASGLATERESGTLALLLCTPLSAERILYDKAVGALRRSAALWGLLAGHVLLFVLMGYVHPIAILHVFLLVAGVLFFLTCVGLYLGVRARKTTAAVAMSAGVAAVLLVGPIILTLALQWQVYLAAGPLRRLSPVGQVFTVSQGADLHTFSYATRGLSYDWGLGPDRTDWLFATVFIAAVTLVYVAAGLGATARAARRLRKAAV